MTYDDEDAYQDDDDWESLDADADACDDDSDVDDDDDSVETVVCPSCGCQIYEEAELCPYCHEYVTHSTSALAGKPLWYVVAAMLGIAAVIAVLLH